MSKPLLKWAGGKRQLLKLIEESLPQAFKDGEITRFAEPFFGGGAVFFYLSDKYNITEAYISDLNIELILLYKAVQKAVCPLIDLLEEYNKKYIAGSEVKRKEMFYTIRDKFNSRTDTVNINKIDKAMIERAAQIVFLNRTCFNGLFRVNRSGHFNVPAGKYKRPKIIDSENLKKASSLLQKVEIEHASYNKIPEHFLKDTFIYLDPPYRPLSSSSNFTAYSKYSFNDESQSKLASFYQEKSSNKNLHLMLSNSDPKNTDQSDEFFDLLYKGFNIQRIKANRMINSNSSKRGKISELLITNY